MNRTLPTRIFPRLLVSFVAACALLAAPAAAKNTSVATLTPNQGGSFTIAAPTTFKVTLNTPDVAYDADGNRRIKAVKANLPEQLLFNSIGFTQCTIPVFLESHICPAASKIGRAVVLADGGPDLGPVQAIADLYFGSGFSILARVTSDSPAVIDEAVVGELRSSSTVGYGLQMYIPVPGKISEPIDDIFPIVRSVTATVRPPYRTVRNRGSRRGITLPLAGLGPCSGPMNFAVSVVYTDGGGLAENLTDGAPTTARCRK